MPHWRHNSRGRLEHTISSSQLNDCDLIANTMEHQGNHQQSQHEAHEENLHLYQFMRGNMHPLRMSTPLCIIPSNEQIINSCDLAYLA